MPAKPEILNDRASILLKKLIDSYISDGQPVGSKKLAKDAGLDISPATIRNVMSGLEKQGLVAAPHTSAGRIPTEKGFRFFVDSLLEVKPLHKQLLERLKKELDPDQDKDTLINQANRLMTELTHMAGVITLPKPSQAILRHIEFLTLPEKRVLAILVTNEKEVQNRVIHLDKEYTSAELQRAANLLNQEFSGKDIFKIRRAILSELQQARQDMDSVMKTAIDVAGKALPEESLDSQPYLVKGKSNLVRYSSSTSTEQLQQMLESFSHKHEMLRLLDRCIQAEGVKIFIGKEVGVEGLGDCSVISAPYSVKGELMGVLGVIGPTRLSYDKIIPVVDVTARLLGEALNK